MQKLIATLLFIPFLCLSILVAVTMGGCFKDPEFPRDLVKMAGSLVKPSFPDKTTQKVVTIHIPFHDSPGAVLPVQTALEATGVSPSDSPAVEIASAQIAMPPVETSIPMESPQPAPVLDTPNVVTENPTIKLSGKTVSMGRNISTSYSYDTISKNGVSKRGIQITVSTFMETPQQATIEIIFLWRNKGSDQLDFENVLSRDVIVTRHDPKNVNAADIGSDQRSHYIPTGQETISGQRYVGWIARASDSTGKVVAVTASTTAYEKYGYKQ